MNIDEKRPWSTEFFKMENFARHEVTRVEFTIGLREHFSMPFIFAQYAAVGNFFNVFNPKLREPTRVDNEVPMPFPRIQHLKILFANRDYCVPYLGRDSNASRVFDKRVFVVVSLAISRCLSTTPHPMNRAKG